MPTMIARELYADIGGTNGRFAIGRPGATGFERVDILPSEHYASMEDLARGWRALVPGLGISHASVAIAGPVFADRGSVTNRHWNFRKSDLRDALGAEKLLLINDFEALSYALPDLTDAAVMQIGGGTPVPGSPKLVIGPGTGLGVGLLVPDSLTGWRAIPSEGGHVTLPAVGADEVALTEILSAMDQRYGGRVDAEDAISGSGLLAIYRAVAQRDGLAAVLDRPDAISDAALAGTDIAAVRALDQFLAWLGVVAGDLALAVVPRGGVYIGGGICRQLAAYLPNSQLRARFDAKGRMAQVVTSIPLFLVLDEAPGLIGAAAALRLLAGQAI
jgi:glucokinase